MEKEKKIEIKEVSLDKLQEDSTNPNRMTTEKFESLKKGIQKYGFLVPVITNKDYLIADGHHRFRAARDLGYEKIPVVALDVSNVDRIMLRQVMNKLRGEHNLMKDIDDFEKIMSDKGDLKEFADLMGQQQDFFRDVIKLKDEEMEHYIVVRDYNKEINSPQQVKQLKLKLTEDQKITIKQKFQTQENLLGITDYFIVLEEE